jgi:anti-anti-sigma regulatory factor
MTDQAHRGTTVVPLPDEIDFSNVAHAYDRLYTALADGAEVVIADLSGTVFCDICALRGLLMLHRHAAVETAQLRLAVPAGGQVEHVAELMGADRELNVYASVREAAAAP